jgi:DNA-binding NarL/FixJ family response regulator
MDIRVVIFEDNHLLRESLFQLINGTQGIKCVGAFADCDDLQFKIKRTTPDVVLMDIQMPGKNGIESTRIIKEYFPEIRIMMQTVVDDDDKIFASICNGASGYLLKNTAPARLLQAIFELNEGGSPLTPGIAQKVLDKFQKQYKVTSGEINELSLREKEILQCLVKGMSYKMIASYCKISIDTVRFHIRNIYQKLHVSSKSEAVSKAIRSSNFNV